MGPKVFGKLLEIENQILSEGQYSSLPQWLYENRELSLRQISKLFGIDATKWSTVLDFYGIPRPSQAEAASKASKGQVISEDQKAQISKSLKKRYQDDPEYRQVLSQRTKKHWQDLLAEHEAQIQEEGSSPHTPTRYQELQERRTAAIVASTQRPERNQKVSESHKRRWANFTEEERESELTHLREVNQQIEQDEQKRERRVANLRERHERVLTDPEIRRQQSELSSRIMTRLHHDPVFGANFQESQRRRWENPENRENVAEQLRQRARERAINGTSQSSIGIDGFRGDLNRYTQSLWEANIARILHTICREFYMQESFLLDVPEEYKDLFNRDTTEIIIDFVTQNAREELSLYEIIANPLENPVGLAKIDMMIQQYPDLDIHVISEDFYLRLEKAFKKRVNANPQLAGWETYKDNIRNNPEKFGRTTIVFDEESASDN